MEIKKDLGMQGAIHHVKSGDPATSFGGIVEPKDSFAKGRKPSKSMRKLQMLMQSGVAQAVLKREKKEPVPIEKAAYWTYEAEDKHSLEEIYRTPSGTTFVCCHSFDTEHRNTPRAYTIAFDDKGNEIWKYRPDKKYSIDAHAFVADGTCYIVCNGEERWDRPYIVALNPDGTQRWRFQPKTDEKCTSLQVGPDGTVYAKIKSELYAIDNKDGSIKWKHKIGIYSDDYFHEIAPDGTNILANDSFSLNFGNDIYYGVDAQGRKKEVKLPDTGTFPIRDNLGHIYFGGDNGQFYGIDLSTRSSWQITLDAKRGLQTPHWGKDGKIYVEGRYDNKNLYVIDPQGKLVWQQQIDDHRPLGIGIEPFYQVTKDGSVFYALDGKDAIQQIDAQGNKVKQIEVAGGFSEFVADEKGNLYIRQYDNTIVFYNLKSDQRFYFPMEIAGNISMKEVLDDGTIVFQGMCEIYHVRLDKDEEVKKLLEEIENEQKGPEKEKDSIVVDDNWVIIGNVKIPRN